jgi:hypothetical protein
VKQDGLFAQTKRSGGKERIQMVQPDSGIGLTFDSLGHREFFSPDHNTPERQLSR